MSKEPLVIKFGGTSVGDGAAFGRAARITAEVAQRRPVAVVVSAMSGVTDALVGYVETTAGTAARTATGATREGAVAELYRALAGRHLAAAREAVDEKHLPMVEKRLLDLLRELVEAINGAQVSPEARRAEIAGYGERLSAEILCGAVRSAGAACAVSPGDPIATDGCFDEAAVCAAGTRERCRRYVAPLLAGGIVAVVPGYVGRSPEGWPTTLGRGGSDLSATVLGRALACGEVWIMSDVDGVLDADPRLVPDASTLRRLSYREAALFACLGAKVLHHRTMEPASEAGLEVLVRNTFDPYAAGTRISFQDGGPGVRCVALRRGLRLQTVEAGDPCARRSFCVLGGDGSGIRILVDGSPGAVAAVVGIGAPTEGDLMRGLRALRAAEICSLWAGNTARGLVFVVSAHQAEKALRAVHSAVVRRARDYAGEHVA